MQHHWTDVSAGSLIGVVTASLTARYVSTLMKNEPNEEKPMYSINSGVPTDPHRSQSNYDLEAQQIPKTQPSREH